MWWPSRWRSGCRRSRCGTRPRNASWAAPWRREAVADWADQQARDGAAVSTEHELALVEAVFAALFGLGRLQALVDDERIENIEINGADQVWLSYADGREEPGPAVADSDEELVENLQFLAARVGQAERTFTTAHPRLHLRLHDGSRLAAMAWTTPRPQVVIRRHRVRDVDADDLVPLGTLDSCLAAFLRAAIRAGKNVVVTGLQNAGKTTLIRALANEFHPMERFATIEKEYELHLHDLPHRHPRVVAMEAREGSAERMVNGRPAGEVDLSDLVTDALRMNLRRLIVGEVRGDEAVPMLEAMSTGDGSVCTIHARSARQAIERLVTLCLRAQPGMTDTFAYRFVAGAVDLIVNIRPRRRVPPRRPQAPLRRRGPRDRGHHRLRPPRADHRVRSRPGRPRRSRSTARPICPTCAGPGWTRPSSTSQPAPGPRRWTRSGRSGDRAVGRPAGCCRWPRWPGR